MCISCVHSQSQRWQSSSQSIVMGNNFFSTNMYVRIFVALLRADAIDMQTHILRHTHKYTQRVAIAIICTIICVCVSAVSTHFMQYYRFSILAFVSLSHLFFSHCHHLLEIVIIPRQFQIPCQSAQKKKIIVDHDTSQLIALPKINSNEFSYYNSIKYRRHQ